MSRADHIVARRTLSERKPRLRNIIQQVRGFRILTRAFTDTHHKQGATWWRVRLADLVDRRIETKHGVSKYKRRGGHFRPIPAPKPPAKKPDMVGKPQPGQTWLEATGLTRQQARAAYRRACKIAGVPFREER